MAVAGLRPARTGAALAACPAPPAHPSTHAKAHKATGGCIDLNALPQIAANIVAAEPMPAPKASAPTKFEDKPYTGPKVGFIKPEPGVKPTPTVGYHWSLD